MEDDITVEFFKNAIRSRDNGKNYFDDPPKYGENKWGYMSKYFVYSTLFDEKSPITLKTFLIPSKPLKFKL